jgi:hypothetical protein
MTFRQAFALHPKTNEYQIPTVLEKGEIWMQ